MVKAKIFFLIYVARLALLLPFELNIRCSACRFSAQYISQAFKSQDLAREQQRQKYRINQNAKL